LTDYKSSVAQEKSLYNQSYYSRKIPHHHAKKYKDGGITTDSKVVTF
jgi:hypothetical protein